jgi:hypothetical protein
MTTYFSPDTLQMVLFCRWKVDNRVSVVNVGCIGGRSEYPGVADAGDCAAIVVVVVVLVLVVLVVTAY